MVDGVIVVLVDVCVVDIVAADYPVDLRLSGNKRNAVINTRPTVGKRTCSKWITVGLVMMLLNLIRPWTWDLGPWSKPLSYWTHLPQEIENLRASGRPRSDLGPATSNLGPRT